MFLRLFFSGPPAAACAFLRMAAVSGLMAAAGGTAGATQVDWNGVTPSTNLTSTGAPWDATWVAELGSFISGFTPTVENTAQWAAAWRAASRSVYRPATSDFGGSFVYEDANPPDFPEGRRGYLWLFHPEAPQGEWILLTHPDWTWPLAEPLAFPVRWETSNPGTVAVLGRLTEEGARLQSAAVASSPLPPLPWASWQNLYFTEADLSNSAVSGAAADPDRDGASNLAEYSAGTVPSLAASRPAAPEFFLHPENGQFWAAARLTRSTRITGHAWQAAVSTSLSGWAWAGASGGGAGTPVTLTEFPWEWTVRAPAPVSGAPRVFLRFGLVAAP